jgi:hypothetical protein
MHGACLRRRNRPVREKHGRRDQFVAHASRYVMDAVTKILQSE